MNQERAPHLEFEATTVGLLRHAVERFGARDFIVTPDQRLTYAEANRLSRAFAKRLLTMGVTKGTRVAAKYPNGVEWVIAWLAVTRIGGFFMPLSSAYKPGETRKCLRIGDAEIFLTPQTIIGRDQREPVDETLGRPLAELPSPIMHPALPYLRQVVFTSLGPCDNPDAMDLSQPDRSAEDLVSDAFLAEVESEITPADWMLAIFTSGSTSDPKCVVHTHGAPIRHGTAIADLNEWTEEDRIFGGMPYFWVGGNCYTVIPAMLVGACVLGMERFEAGAALDLMEREGATRAIGWPGVIIPLLEHPTLESRNIRAFTDARWTPRDWDKTGLGMSETGSNHTALYVEDRHRPEAAGATGRAIPFVEHRIVDEETGEEMPEGETGNIQVRGYSLMAGYYKREREDTFEPDGFFDTQDRGFLKDGFLHFAGRDVGLIKTAGNNVSAMEVETAIKAMPGIANAFVVGLPDEKLGQVVGAAIVPSEPGTVDVDVILAALKTELSSYKVPKVVKVMESAEVPFMSNGKMDFRALVALIAEAKEG